MTKIAAYDDDGIWGVGDDESTAKQKASDYLNDLLASDELADAMDDLKFAPMSADLYDKLVALDTNEAADKDDLPFVVSESGELVSDDSDSDDVAEEEEGEAEATESEATT